MVINVFVKANSKKGPYIEELRGSFFVYVRELSIEGKANEAVINILAKHFNIPKSRVELIKGGRSKYKKFKINNL